MPIINNVIPIIKISIVSIPIIKLLIIKMSIIKMPPSKLVHHDDDHDFVPSQTRSLISLGSVHLTAVPFCVRQLVPSGTAVTARLMSGMLSHRLIRTQVIGNNSEISNFR